MQTISSFVSQQVKDNMWQIQCTITRLLFSSLSLAATPFLFPVMTDAPSEHKPTNLSTDSPHSLSSETLFVVVAALVESDDSSRFLTSRNLVSVALVSFYQNCTSMTNCSSTAISVTSSIIKPNDCTFRT